jgi:hypothetical protein
MIPETEIRNNIKARAAHTLSFPSWRALTSHVKQGHDIVTVNPLNIKAGAHNLTKRFHHERLLIDELRTAGLCWGFDDVGTLIISAHDVPLTRRQATVKSPVAIGVHSTLIIKGRGHTR